MNAQPWRRRFATGVLGMLALIFAGGTAYAVWHATGVGASTAATTTPQALTASATITGTLRPGGPSRDLAVSVTNPNAQAVTMTALALNGAVTETGSIGSCTTTGVTVTLPPSISLAVPAGATRMYTATGAVTMSTASESGCQGAVFTVPLKVTGGLP
jgi:hypothetical protein